MQLIITIHDTQDKIVGLPVMLTAREVIAGEIWYGKAMLNGDLHGYTVHVSCDNLPLQAEVVKTEDQ